MCPCCLEFHVLLFLLNVLYCAVMGNLSASAGQNGPFFLPGGEPGVLLIHGFLTAPGEMRPLGEYLHAAGMTVLGIQLHGHGQQPEDLEHVSWKDWLSDVETGLVELHKSCSTICVAGLSLGGALTFHVAARHPITRIVAFSAPDSALARHPLLRLTKFDNHLPRFLAKIGSDVRDPKARRTHFTYNRLPLRCVPQILELLQTLDEQLPHVTAPTLLVHARHDLVVPPSTARRIAARLGGPVHIFWVKRGGHTVVLDYDRESVFAQTLAWLQAAGDVPRHA